MKTILRSLLLGGWLAATTITAATATAAEPTAPDKKAAETKPAKPASSLDDELFRELDDGAGRPKSAAVPNAEPTTVARPAAGDEARPQPSSKPSTAAKPAEVRPLPKPSNPLDAELLKELEGDDPQKKKKPESKPRQEPALGDKSDSDDPLVRLSRQIREAESRLRRNESGEETQRLQRDIAEDLEKLIAQIEERQQQKSRQQSGKGTPQPGKKPGEQKQPGSKKGTEGDSSKPADDSNENLRKMADMKADPGKLKNLLEEVWGMLPERQRQDVMQSSVDDFPVKYQYVIEEYFRTLLERRE
jgi:hypothetical protein